MKMNKSLAALAACPLLIAGACFVLLRERRIEQAAARVRGKVVLITGGSRGLGFALAQRFAALGAKIVLASRTTRELESARMRLIDEGALAEDIYIHRCDVASSKQVADLVAAATARFGRIDVLINNAGVILVGPLESHDLSHFEEAMQTNFFGALHCTLAALPQMLARGNGAILNISSIGGRVAFPHLLPYVASKFALAGWSQGLHAELASKGIQVTTVMPGLMLTGSHIQAQFSGDANLEYRWFAAAATLPGTATPGEAAAAKILRAYLSGSAEVCVGTDAVLASRVANLVPELTAFALSLVSRLLPHAPSADGSKESDHHRYDQLAGKNLSNPFPYPVSKRAEKAVLRYNQQS